jgi:hypothetical protein
MPIKWGRSKRGWTRALGNEGSEGGAKRRKKQLKKMEEEDTDELQEWNLLQN